MNKEVKDIHTQIEGPDPEKGLYPREDCSLITIECSPRDYSASRIAMAVEDSDAQLVDLLTLPGRDSLIRVLLRISHSDPTAAVRSLERYDYQIIEARGAGNAREAEIAAERLLSLQMLLNV